jgi:Fic family protein
MIGYIHPFGDGNGRTARALFYWYMLRSGYWLFEFVSISKLIKEKRSDYDTAYIYTETDDFDLTYFIYHQVEVIIKAVDALRAHIAAKKSDFYHFVEWVEKSPVSHKLKRGQLELLKDALKQPGKVFTAKQVAVEFDITENTARTYLNGLVDEDLLMPTKSKKGKEVSYVSPAGLQQRLKL